MELRNYQTDLINRLNAAFEKGHTAPLVVLPTGGGKTFTFAHLAREAVKSGKRVLIIVHRQELLRQASRALSALGLHHGLIAPGFRGESDRVAVGSVQTLDRRLKQVAFHFDVIIIDEAHHVAAGTWARVISNFPNALKIGFTATPIRLDGRGLGKDTDGIFDELVQGPSIADLIRDNYLVPPVVYAYPNEIDLTGLRKVAGDFSLNGLGTRVNKPTITGNAVEHYRRLSPGEPAIAFCASIDHATAVSAEFTKAGFNSEVIHGGLNDSDRLRMVNGLADGSIKVLTSVDLISEGTDIPVCSVAILLRPTQSTGLYLQQVGRILRTANGKARGLVLDHVGNCLNHGLPDDEREWSLNGMRRKQKVDDDGEINLRQCLKCFHLQSSRKFRCENCGFAKLKVIESRNPETIEGELEMIDKEKIAAFKKNKRLAYQQAKTREECFQLAAKFGDKPGFAYKYWNARTISRGGKK